MFEQLTERLDSVFKKLTGRGLLNESDVKAAMKEVRVALLEADVNYKVAKKFITDVKERAVGQEVTKSIRPGHQVIKIVNDELTKLLGQKQSPLNESSQPPTVVMIVGLHGGGKTTLSGKLAKLYKSRGKHPLLVAADIHRPAAKKQLEILAKAINMPFYTSDSNAIDICTESIKHAREKLYDLVILDTAGRLQIDDELMAELESIKSKTNPNEVLFVADSMTGQEAVNVASSFNDKIGITGVALTKMDGDARGGAALSIKAVLDVPVKFIGVGEKLDAIEEFFPDRMASRILGMGDVVTLVEKAQQTVDLEQAQKLEQKLRKEEFTFEDFLDQLKQVKKMGPLESLLEMVPGMGGKLKGLTIDDKALPRMEAIICSMTSEERRNPHIINGSRRKRIARGSGTSVHDINVLLKQFTQMQKMVKKMAKFSFKGFPQGFPI
ncbi:MAG: signal recognition particle protein [candidate division Zixibacteria bacterium]|nr:signal recognition particle protein [candidate division Zixibacteria bacterium]